MVKGLILAIFGTAVEIIVLIIFAAAFFAILAGIVIWMHAWNSDKSLKEVISKERIADVSAMKVLPWIWLVLAFIGLVSAIFFEQRLMREWNLPSLF